MGAGSVAIDFGNPHDRPESFEGNNDMPRVGFDISGRLLHHAHKAGKIYVYASWCVFRLPRLRVEMASRPPR